MVPGSANGLAILKRTPLTRESDRKIYRNNINHSFEPIRDVARAKPILHRVPDSLRFRVSINESKR